MMVFITMTSMTIWAARSKNVLLDMCTQRRFRSDCAFAQSDQNLHWVHFRYPRMQNFFLQTIKTLIRLCRCMCRLILSLHCVHMSEGMFHVAAYIYGFLSILLNTECRLNEAGIEYFFCLCQVLSTKLCIELDPHIRCFFFSKDMYKCVFFFFIPP